eukprot:gene7758-biopygen18069
MGQSTAIHGIDKDQPPSHPAGCVSISTSRPWGSVPRRARGGQCRPWGSVPPVGVSAARGGQCRHLPSSEASEPRSERGAGAPRAKGQQGGRGGVLNIRVPHTLLSEIAGRLCQTFVTSRPNMRTRQRWRGGGREGSVRDRPPPLRPLCPSVRRTKKTPLEKTMLQMAGSHFCREP